MVKGIRPKQVTRPDGEDCIARYERVSRGRLPANVTIQRRYTQRVAPKNTPRQAGRGLFRPFSSIFKIVRSPPFKTLGRVELKSAPVIHDYAKSK